MSFIEGIVEWSKTSFLQFGELGLFAVSFMESSFFPVPPDIILIPLILARPELALWYAFVCTIASTMGAVLGYYIGDKGGRPALRKLVSEKKVKKVDGYFKKYGVLAVGVAGFSPIPYKIFTISAGIFKLNLLKVLVVSFFCRGARFFLEALILMWFGEQILDFLFSYFEIATLIVIIVAVAVYLAYRKFWKSNNQ